MKRKKNVFIFPQSIIVKELINKIKLIVINIISYHLKLHFKFLRLSNEVIAKITLNGAVIIDINKWSCQTN